MNSVEDIAKKLGAEIRVNSKVTSLVHDGNNVKGVRVEDKQHTYIVNAEKVILATVGFTRNRNMVAAGRMASTRRHWKLRRKSITSRTDILAAGELIFGNMFQVRYPASGTGMGHNALSGQHIHRSTRS